MHFSQMFLYVYRYDNNTQSLLANHQGLLHVHLKPIATLERIILTIQVSLQRWLPCYLLILFLKTMNDLILSVEILWSPNFA